MDRVVDLPQPGVVLCTNSTLRKRVPGEVSFCVHRSDPQFAGAAELLRIDLLLTGSHLWAVAAEVWPFWRVCSSPLRFLGSRMQKVSHLVSEEAF